MAAEFHKLMTEQLQATLSKVDKDHPDHDFLVSLGRDLTNRTSNHIAKTRQFEGYQPGLTRDAIKDLSAQNVLAPAQTLNFLPSLLLMAYSDVVTVAKAAKETGGGYISDFEFANKYQTSPEYLAMLQNQQLTAYDIERKRIALRDQLLKEPGFKATQSVGHEFLQWEQVHQNGSWQTTESCYSQNVSILFQGPVVDDQTYERYMASYDNEDWIYTDKAIAVGVERGRYVAGDLKPVSIELMHLHFNQGRRTFEQTMEINPLSLVDGGMNAVRKSVIDYLSGDSKPFVQKGGQNSEWQMYYPNDFLPLTALNEGQVLDALKTSIESRWTGYLGNNWSKFRTMNEGKVPSRANDLLLLGPPKSTLSY